MSLVCGVLAVWHTVTICGESECGAGEVSAVRPEKPGTHILTHVTVTGPYSPLQVIERFGRTRVEVARAAAVLDGVGLRLPCSGTGGTGLHELAHLVVHGRVDLGGGAQVAAAEGCVGAGKLEHGGLG